ISIVDKDRNMVALTQTISSFFGAGVMVEGTGVILNNEVYNFSTDKTSGNRIAPNKRMRTSISPTVVLRDGMPFLTIGTPGATRIVPTMAQLLTNIIDFNMGLQEAINAPRFFVREGSDAFEYESRMPSGVLEDLKNMGYPIDEKSMRGEYDLYFGGAQAVMVDPVTGELVGAADPRRDGAAAGY
ncbi:MAG TPA: gamma-glutamyltransferase, partial [Firmicutes bacterium]|nr:gamma-glutamyltransferase [Bacillota bacterium]